MMLKALHSNNVLFSESRRFVYSCVTMHRSKSYIKVQFFYITIKYHLFKITMYNQITAKRRKEEAEAKARKRLQAKNNRISRNQCGTTTKEETLAALRENAVACAREHEKKVKAGVQERLYGAVTATQPEIRQMSEMPDMDDFDFDHGRSTPDPSAIGVTSFLEREHSRKSRKDYWVENSIEMKKWYLEAFEINGHPDPCLKFPNQLGGEFECHCTSEKPYEIFCFMLHCKLNDDTWLKSILI